MESLSLFAEPLLSIVVSELITAVVNNGKAGYKCRDQCKKLEVELNGIKEDVECIMTRISSIKTLDPEHKHLKMAERWLDKLTTVMEKAKEEVRQCNNSRWSFHTRLSDKLTASFRDIKAVADIRYNITILLDEPELTTKSTGEGSTIKQEVSVDTWFLPSPKSSTKVNARENTDNRRPQHHAQPSHHVAFQHNGHISSTLSQPNHYHFLLNVLNVPYVH
uniref:Rx N-terminal domain-containing protein n=1 Tax=Physcomitrium patens TaxID=3218 RepID=A0A2K1JGG3_PHYPA|nr:hypothetical protein PHYPA_018040 [Physcomitrium patens]